jgi:ribosomal protein S18 acetylase RimI-like enzyme
VKLVPGPSIELRDAIASDAPFLARMLRDCLYWRAGDDAPSLEQLQADEDFQRHWQEWGRPGDTALIATAAGDSVGAGWYRLWRPRDRMAGFFDARVPVLSLAVRTEFRGSGYGQRLLDALIDRALDSGVPGLSVSVSGDNPALQWFERRDFMQVAQVRDAWTMMLDAPLARVKRRSHSGR